MDLTCAPRDRDLLVTAVSSPGRGMQRRLIELGIRPGTTLRVLRRTAGRGAIVAVADDRLALARSVLAGISVADPGSQPSVPAGTDRAGVDLAAAISTAVNAGHP